MLSYPDVLVGRIAHSTVQVRDGLRHVEVCRFG